MLIKVPNFNNLTELGGKQFYKIEPWILTFVRSADLIKTNHLNDVCHESSFVETLTGYRDGNVTFGRVVCTHLVQTLLHLFQLTFVLHWKKSVKLLKKKFSHELEQERRK